ncbi:Oidioi.mRNA.OKI2018_I69.chr2.g6605.t1.cds [Oikopleura dioica]|uniref:Oidioi.mRNA.OKI2018_I69.chr2.g6605.t1.cds n=1 Tax=Oikopleura dioica TaxID=34765 RepID=A0ABN7T3J8_OIKDI|nr:Oidioi.mRNA.OKI2018_I69.chr2.g6605.t1.cds [Oikopleura dioica]
MFYSSEFCDQVYSWLLKLASNGCRFRVLIGDPGRNFLDEHHHLLEKCKVVFTLDYPKEIQQEYPGFHTGTVYELAHTDLI